MPDGLVQIEFSDLFISLFLYMRGAAHYLRPSDFTSPGEEWWCGPRGTHHHFKTHQRLGTKEALAGEHGRKGTVSYYNGGKHVLHLARCL